MFGKHLKLALAVAISAGCLSHLAAAGPDCPPGASCTDPVGFVIMLIRGNGGAEEPEVTFASMPMTPPVVFQAAVVSVDGSRINLGGEFLEDDRFNGENGAHFIEMVTGPYTGLIVDIVDTDPDSLVMGRDLEGLVNSGDFFLIRKHWTFREVFGDDNRAGLLEGITLEEADNVVLWDPADQIHRSYYFSNASQNYGWREENGTVDQGGTAIKYPYGMVIARRAPEDLDFRFLGSVKVGKTLLPVRPGRNILSLAYVADITLENSGMFEEGSLFSVFSGPDATSADLVLFDGSLQGSTPSFYYRSGNSLPGSAGWREVGGGPSGDFLIPAASALVIHRVGPAGYIQIDGIFEALEPDPAFASERFEGYADTEVVFDGLDAVCIVWETDLGKSYQLQAVGREGRRFDISQPIQGDGGIMNVRRQIGDTRYEFYQVKIFKDTIERHE